MHLVRLTLLSIAFFSFVSTAFPGNVFGAEDGRHYSSGRHESCIPVPPITGYNQNLVNLIIGSTPLEQGDRWAHHIESAGVLFDVDASGRLSNWRMASLSGSIATDFWTLYAVVTCPPSKPPEGVSTPLTTKIDNARIALVSSKEAEEWRIQEGSGIPRKAAARNIYFYLIPASFIASFPNTVTISDISDKQNLVGIPIESICSDGKHYWSIESANTLIKTPNHISKFLSEWSQFSAKNPHPSREEILSYAGELKKKYSTLLKEGEPEAPLP